MLKNYLSVLLMLGCQVAIGQITYTYDNAGNRIKRVAGTPPVTTGCYTMKMAGNGRFLTNVNGILKVKPASNTDSQRWKIESSGPHVKIKAGDNRVVGVANGGNTEGDILTLQTDGTADHLLWSKTPMPGSNPASEAFVRKNSTLLIGSPLNWGDGDPSDLITDVRLGNDPTYVWGASKWILETSSCPVNPNMPVITTSSSNLNPAINASFTLTSSCSGDCSGVSYVWRLGTTTVGTTANVTLSAPSTPGSYSYTLTASKGGSTVTSTVTVNVTAPCYTMKLASNSKLLTNVNGVLKVKPANNTDSQKWRLESSGPHVKVVAPDNRVLGVAGGGNTDGDIITLQTNGTADHLLWSKTPIPGSSPASEAFIRKNSTLLIGSPFNWGDGDPSDLVTDVLLGNDPTYIYGASKWILETTSCPSSSARIGMSEVMEVANVSNPDAEVVNDLTVSPNPNQGEFEVSFYLESDKGASLTIVNPDGRRFYHKKLIGKGHHTESVNLTGVNSGIFIIQLVTETGSKSKKISVAK
ncbi:T9SS type A sorting domain-containing protein [Dyadobacter sp. CY312]|uniref:T9SS type A sorting domain-containing protein n=1 Tax=Dyadobacter sp. CY312 TaxID=2907303 RepID=UPI001F3D46B2|nr:T9SS type A sorting domain-containing protein [Dyadobacter sp. CY312]MCE7043820.1 T9SS type A sorting domain-containing protein [Dyadobacter sp. CY312]